ncbi:hypothetical protein K3495_g10987 [Podosphaera aphanis]|nr:hypothetical protein K3495_g10987 [Podosphaera aphanis]
MPMYRDQTEPAWSNGWLQRFQQLYGIHKTRRYGDASSALASHDEEIRTIQQALTDFPLRDTYNCDETGLFYKSVPEVSLTTCQLSGHKANSVVFQSCPCTEAELVSLAEKVASQRGIENISSINDFVTPTSEEVFDDINTSEELYLEEIAELFDSETQIENDEEDFEELGSGADFNKVDLDEAIAATKLLLIWQEQSGDGDGAKHLAYTRDLRQLQNRQENSRKQSTITSFFSVDEG